MGGGWWRSCRALLLAEGERPRPGFRLAAAHRLDRGTSGLVVFCLSGLALRGGARAAARPQRAEALPGAGGRRAAPAGGRDRAGAGAGARRRRGRGPAGGDTGRAAGGDAVCDRAGGAGAGACAWRSFRLEPATGRRHQLRVHLAALGCPILGDRRYGEPEANRRFAELSGLERLWLHAAELELRHPRSGARLVLRSPVPAEFELALERLRGRREG
ncbi:MAG: hypothetical protein KatS3mg102_2203 [Planctomycetota bacterium]|nr:MAG: hypothetical protein KatS3mg102_2203 [Planctomycetota bacterium]